MADTFWIHESAQDPDEFGAATPDEALRRWLLYGAGTQDGDPDGYDSDASINERCECEHGVYRCEWVTVRDQAHLTELLENSDTIEDEYIDGLKVGDRFWHSTGYRKMRAKITIIAEYVAPKATA
jgi:hypothetical protein